jgi:DNA-binding Lrp family transcriptional regulator
MPKLFPIRLEVEEIAVGAVLRQLHMMVGVAKVDLDLGPAAQKPANGNPQEIIMALLMKGPTSRSILGEAVGGSKTRFYSAISELKKKHLIKANGKIFSLADKVAREMGVQQPLALPPPVKRKNGKRASPGVARAALVMILTQTPGLRTIQIRDSLGRNGMSPKSVSGIMERAKTDAVIKKVGDGWHLTAKGQKLTETPTTESANG